MPSLQLSLGATWEGQVWDKRGWMSSKASQKNLQFHDPEGHREKPQSDISLSLEQPSLIPESLTGVFPFFLGRAWKTGSTWICW